MRIPVHSPWLPGYIGGVQTILVILTMLDFFWTDILSIYLYTDRYYIYVYICLYICVCVYLPSTLKAADNYQDQGSR